MTHQRQHLAQYQERLALTKTTSALFLRQRLQRQQTTWTGQMSPGAT